MSEGQNNYNASQDGLLVVKGVMIGLSVFIGAVIIVVERWIYTKCRKLKYKRNGIKTKGFVNLRKQALSGKTLMTFHNMDIEFIIQDIDKTKLYIIFVHIKLMPKVEYMIQGWDHSHEINVRYIPLNNHDLLNKQDEFEYYLIGGKSDIDAKPTYKRKKKICKENLKSFLMFVCLLIGDIPFFMMAVDPSFYQIGLACWGMGIVFGTIYFCVKPKVEWTSTVTKVYEVKNDEDLKKYRKLKDINIDLTVTEYHSA